MRVSKMFFVHLQYLNLSCESHPPFVKRKTHLPYDQAFISPPTSQMVVKRDREEKGKEQEETKKVKRLTSLQRNHVDIFENTLQVLDL